MAALKYLFVLVLLLVPITGWGQDIRYELEVNIDAKGRTLTGAGIIRSQRPAAFHLSVTGLQDVRLNGRPVTPNGHQQVAVRMTAQDPIRISYTADFKNSGKGVMDAENVFLTGQWYPRPDTPVRHHLSVNLPDGFVAVSESESVTVAEQGGRKTFRFHFDNPLEGLHLAASTNYAVKKTVHAGIAIEAYFFKSDAALADTYIDYTKKYLDLYAGMLTPYPYKRFAIVENILPTGYSMPTFTLLGRAVVKLPFIVETSLGHEILHQWFGNSVYIDNTRGNWAEGLTSYLADHHYAERDGRGPLYRKQIMLDYQAYVNDGNVMPVSSFLSRQDRAQAAVGYGKAAMIFHMLRRQFGDERFFESLRALIREQSFRTAAWPDIQHAFEETTGADLDAFFEQWLNRRDLPTLEVANVGYTRDDNRLALRFDIRQNEPPYRLTLPVTVQSAGGPYSHAVALTRSSEEVVIPLEAPPTGVVIDGEYAIMRTLVPNERPPILADIMGSDSLFVAAAPGQRAAYRPLIDALKIRKAAWIDPGKMTFSRLENATVVVAGFDNPLVDRLLGGRRPSTDGVRLEVYKNPWAPEKRLLLVHAASAAESGSLTRTLSHYGKYSTLAFRGGRSTHKSTAPAPSGITVLEQPQPLVVRPAQKETLADILTELGEKRIVFVGEQHDRFAHHLNQLQVIRGLAAAGAKIAVGMEMFQAPFQAAIDAFLGGEIDERTFLARTEYFDRWGYDYHLYKPIVDFLKANRIPLIALNISGDISRQTGRRGLDSLSKTQRRQVPDRLDFSDETYRADLRQVYNLHGSDVGLDEFNYFYQAQTLWDETMASRAAAWLTANPDYKLVVLAGNGHLRYKYGIPQRLFRRTRQPYAVILQDEEIADGIADYVLFTTEIEGAKAPRLGIRVEEQGGALVVKSAIEHAPAGKAGLKGGDVIIALNGHRIGTLADLKLALFYTKNGERISIEVDRDGTLVRKEVELKTHPKHMPLKKH